MTTLSTRAPSHPLPTFSSDTRGWEHSALEALERLGIGVVVCDWAFRVRVTSDLGLRILRGFAPDHRPGTPLPPPLRIAVEEAALTAGPHRGTLRVDNADGGVAVYLTVAESRQRAGDWLLTLRREVLRDDLLQDRMRARFGITFRDAQLIALLRRGCCNRDIAARLGLTLGTVKSYVHRLFERTGVRSRTELLALIERVRAGDA